MRKLILALIMVPTLASAGVWDSISTIVGGHYEDAKSRINVVNEKIEGEVVHTGEFRDDDIGSDTLHRGSGMVTIELKDGKRYLQFHEDFTTTPGPDYHVYVSPAKKIVDEATFMAATTEEVARLKRGVGAQYYELNNKIDAFSVTIWCKKFGAFITSATIH